MVHHNSVPIPASRTKESLLKLLVEEGFISSFTKREEGSKTLYQKKIDEKEKFLNKEKENEVFKEMKNIFPDADLIDVKERKDE